MPLDRLPPVSYEALEANNRSTHANLNFCIQERDRFLSALREAKPHFVAMLDAAEKGLAALAIADGVPLAATGEGDGNG